MASNFPRSYPVISPLILINLIYWNFFLNIFCYIKYFFGLLYRREGKEFHLLAKLLAFKFNLMLFCYMFVSKFNNIIIYADLTSTYLRSDQFFLLFFCCYFRCNVLTFKNNVDYNQR